MSLGIIVTLFVCMVQRFESSMRPAIYASAASCKHIIACPWKCMSYLPTSRAILWTNHAKGSFQMRSSVIFWNHWILVRATVLGKYFLVFLTLLAFKNSFQGALPPMVGQSFFLASSSLPNVDAAIWANCWVANDGGDLPTPSSHSASAILLIISSAPGGVCGAGDGGALVMRGPSLFLLHVPLHRFLIPSFCPPLPFWGSPSFLPYCNLDKESQPIGKQLDFDLTRVRWQPF